MKSILRPKLPQVLVGCLIAGALAVGTAQAAPVTLDPDQSSPAAIATGDASGSAATGSVSSSELAILRVLLLCQLGLMSGQSCNLMP
ncbi:MAG: hypothetical protein JWN03_3137 [Nocardia sp.]|uniref:hypothetical protein n=1 Tax=Nocardia sp. TaxID=1821 RepID=UPI002625A516|nr:hypothetical protein [Nocardia sp.]MCU1642862.1 hypothetical protein [Nocardia sp.]